MDIYSYCFDELVKQASSDYYQRNRGRILAQQRKYYQANRHSIARNARIRRRKIKSGMHRQRKRQHVGTSYVYTGYR